MAVRTDVPFFLTLDGAAVNWQMGALDGTPVPLRIALWGLPGALLVTLATPIRPAVAVGVKVMPRLHEALAARLTPQLLLATAKSPVVSISEIKSGALPVLVSVEFFAALVVPMI